MVKRKKSFAFGGIRCRVFEIEKNSECSSRALSAEPPKRTLYSQGLFVCPNRTENFWYNHEYENNHESDRHSFPWRNVHEPFPRVYGDAYD